MTRVSEEGNKVGVDVLQLNTPPAVWTIGHSTRSAFEFNQILKSYAIENLVDVRSFPGSRRYPHFNKEQLAESLSESGIDYYHFASLGGRRRPRVDSRNTAWKNDSFRGYADYMESEDFRQGIYQLIQLARVRRTAMMCAEALWWRCHRSLIADYLKVLGTEVVHIIDEKHMEKHPYTSVARIIGGKLSYEGLLADESSESPA